MKYIIGSRGSKLALTQTEYVCKRLRDAYPMHTFEIAVIRTKGDKIQDKPLHEIGGKGLFVKEIEDKILSGEIHMGVHSMKDMPASPASGLIFTKSWKREDPRDVLILREAESLSKLKYGAMIGTGSKRRAFQLKRLRPDLQIVNLRGNVDTRLRKMKEQKLDGIVLAAAGLLRLGMQDYITQYLEPEEMISAPAQGILALEIRKDQIQLKEMLDHFADEETFMQMQGERTFLEEIGGSCHTPSGARCQKDGNSYRLDAVFGDEDGKKLAFTRVFGNDPKQLAKQAARQIRKKLSGMVYLIGGGPGDPGLITVKGKEILQDADCLIYDRLIPKELLNETKASCEKIYVGKENHHHTMKQEEINHLLVQKAMEYEKIVRLKGGDPYVFGRGGEEGLFLFEHQIPFKVIPGISSCIAGPESAGIPVTHRGVATGFHVVTAHDRKNQLADLDFHSMARSKDTLVFLMGLSKLEEILNRLLKEGMSEDTKAAVISHAASPNQKVCTGTLTNLSKKVREEGLTSPAIIVVGEVVSLRSQLKNDDSNRLFLVTKVGEKTSELTKVLCQDGLWVKEFQTGEICLKQCRWEKKEIEKMDVLIFTSRYGVKSFMKNLKESKLDIRCLSKTKIAVIGKQTAKTLESFGVFADWMPEQAGEDALVNFLKDKISITDCVWHMKGTMGGENLKNRLKQICDFHEKILYENVEKTEEEAAQISDYCGISFSCASSVRRFFAKMEEEDAKIWKEKMPCFSIGNKTTKQLRKLGVHKIFQAEETTYLSMKQKILEIVQEDKKDEI